MDGCVLIYSRDTRELAFQQVQNALALKDLELARLQQGHTHLVAEVADLRRVAKREGVNMDYLKNVVLQYMTFPPSSAERNALVPVLALLLQFSPAELAQADAASKTSIWTSTARPVKEVKLHPVSSTAVAVGMKSEEQGSPVLFNGMPKASIPEGDSHRHSESYRVEISEIGGYQPPHQKYNEV